MKQSLVGFSSIGEGSLLPPAPATIGIVVIEVVIEVTRSGFRHLFNVNEDVFRGGTYV